MSPNAETVATPESSASIGGDQDLGVDADAERPDAQAPTAKQERIICIGNMAIDMCSGAPVKLGMSTTQDDDARLVVVASRYLAGLRAKGYAKEQAAWAFWRKVERLCEIDG